MRWEDKTINQIIQAYKDRVPGATEELISRFSMFLGKFESVIIDNAPVHTGKSIRYFLKLFIPNLDSFISGNKTASGVSHTGAVVDRIHNIIMSRYEADEVRNIIVQTFLECASRYNPINEDLNLFHVYLSKCFHFRLYTNIMVIIKDGLNIALSEDKYISFNTNDKNFSHTDKYNLNTYRPILNRLKVEDDMVVDDNWVMGITADEFDYLTVYERHMLKLKFVDKYSDEELGDLVGLSRKSANSRKLELLAKVKANAVAKRLLKE